MISREGRVTKPLILTSIGGISTIITYVTMIVSIAICIVELISSIMISSMIGVESERILILSSIDLRRRSWEKRRLTLNRECLKRLSA